MVEGADIPRPDQAGGAMSVLMTMRVSADPKAIEADRP